MNCRSNSDTCDSIDVKDHYQLITNALAQQGTFKASSAFLPTACEAAREEISSWPNYKQTPLVSLSGLARANNLAQVWYKDEAHRFGLGSFKALGGAYALFRLLQKKIAELSGTVPTSDALRKGAFKAITKEITVTTATDGNHGRSVAWGASQFHCPCIVYVPRQCSRNRQLAIEKYGAKVMRCTAGYDTTVRRCNDEAKRKGWLVVSDTSWEEYEEIPTIVMQGYTVMTAEIRAQMGPAPPPTHVFVQGGVGGLAAAVCAGFFNLWGVRSPKVIVVEPSGAACLFASAVAGKPTPARGKIHTIMAGLDCGRVSPVAWRVLSLGAQFFMTVPDSVVPHCMRLLAFSPYGDPRVVAGESAIAGLACLLHVVKDEEARRLLGLTPESRILLLGTEGATDPDLYKELIQAGAQLVRRGIV
jgi:diaminopropionate ammonia-lyase